MDPIRRSAAPATAGTAASETVPAQRDVSN